MSEQQWEAERAETFTQSLADDLCAKAHTRRFDPSGGVFHCQECYEIACEVMDTPTMKRSADVVRALADEWESVGSRMIASSRGRRSPAGEKDTREGYALMRHAGRLRTLIRVLHPDPRREGEAS